MANLDAVRQHLERNLSNHSPDAVVGYLEQWAIPGRQLELRLSGSYVQFPSPSGLAGRHDEQPGIPLPWIFRSAEAADQFCSLVESSLRASGARCVVSGRQADLESQ